MSSSTRNIAPRTSTNAVNFRFIDTYLHLNAQEEQLFQMQLSTLGLVQQEEVMEIVTSWMERGIEQGRQEEARSLILRQLNRRIGTINSTSEAQIRSLLMPLI